MPAKKKTANSTRVASLRHKGARKSIPIEELRDFVAEDESATGGPNTMLYPRLDTEGNGQSQTSGHGEESAQEVRLSP